MGWETCHQWSRPRRVDFTSGTGLRRLRGCIDLSICHDVQQRTSNDVDFSKSRRVGASVNVVASLSNCFPSHFMLEHIWWVHRGANMECDSAAESVSRWRSTSWMLSRLRSGPLRGGLLAVCGGVVCAGESTHRNRAQLSSSPRVTLYFREVDGRGI